MRLLVLLALCVLLSGCRSGKDPFEGKYWAETDSGFPALCIPGDTVRCFQPSQSDREYFREKVCRVESSET